MTSRPDGASLRVPAPGETVAGKYALKRLIGEGGMGVVLEAEHVRLRQPIAIKFLNPEMLASDEIVERFEREARAAATLRSRHVVRVTDVEVTSDGIPYMVMELLSGVDLESERERRKKLPPSEAVDYVLQACGALAEAHDAGIIHRDLKPANLFLANEDGGVVVKVLDFGISKFMKGEDAKLTSAGAVLGTALYMSPEQIRGAAAVDGRSDVWSLGVILYELIGGRPPWDGPTTRVAAAIVTEDAPDLRRLAELPEELAATIHRMLEKDPERRPASIADVVRMLLPFAPPGSVGATIADTLARRTNPSSRRVTAAAASSSSPPIASASTGGSTMAATTSATAPRRPSRSPLVAASAFFVLGAVALLAVALRRPTAPAARSEAPADRASSAPLAASVSAANAGAASGSASSAPTAAVSEVRAVASAPVLASGVTAASAPRPPAAKKPPPAPHPKPSAAPAVNPPFLQ